MVKTLTYGDGQGVRNPSLVWDPRSAPQDKQSPESALKLSPDPRSALFYRNRRILSIHNKSPQSVSIFKAKYAFFMLAFSMSILVPLL